MDDVRCSPVTSNGDGVTPSQGMRLRTALLSLTSQSSKRSYLLSNKLDLNNHDVIASRSLLLSDTANIVKIKLCK